MQCIERLHRVQRRVRIGSLDLQRWLGLTQVLVEDFHQQTVLAGTEKWKQWIIIPDWTTFSFWVNNSLNLIRLTARLCLTIRSILVNNCNLSDIRALRKKKKQFQDHRIFPWKFLANLTSCWISACSCVSAACCQLSAMVRVSVRCLSRWYQMKIYSFRLLWVAANVVWWFSCAFAYPADFATLQTDSIQFSTLQCSIEISTSRSAAQIEISILNGIN